MVILSVFVVVALVAAAWIAWSHFLGAPWVPASRASVHRMLTAAEVGPEDTVVDLGSGDGRIVIAAARHFGARGLGVEIDAIRFAWSRLRISLLGLGDQVRVVLGDLHSFDLSEATVVACYLLEHTNDQLVDKLRRELRPGARVVSKTFRFSGLEILHEDEGAKVYVYRV
jgi:cyclopropane fatty-acyl-phospholipid synthase-like methyltransferase